MPHPRRLIRVLTLSLAPVLALAPCRLALADHVGPEPDPSTVMVWPSDTEDEGVEDVEAALEQAGHAVAPFGPVAIGLREGRAARREALQTELSRVDAALAAAQQHYLAQSWDEMIAGLEAIEGESLVWLAQPQACGALWEIEFRLGLGYLSRKAEGDTERRTDHFATAFALDPDRRPLADLYGPDVTSAFLLAVDTAAARAARPTAIEASPEDARVMIDCHAVDNRSTVPLSPGRHVIRVDAPGYVADAKVVSLADGEPITIALQPDPTEDPVARLATTWPSPQLLPVGPASRAAISGIAKGQGAERWVVLAPVDGGVRAELWREGRRRNVEQRPAAPEAALDVLARPRPRGSGPGDGDTTTGPAGPVGPAGPTDTKKPLVRRWWFWTAIAGGVAATGLGLGLGLGLRDNTPSRLQVVVR